MRRYLRSRLTSAAVIVLAVTIINFLITRILPGNPVDAIMGEFPAPPGYVDKVRHDFGLDQPVWIQLWLYLQSLVQGNLGFSFANRQQVLPLILHRAGVTLLLMLPSLTVASIAGVLLAGAAAQRLGSLWDTLLTSVSLGGYSVPVFWLAQMLIVVFAVRLDILPAQGMLSVTSDDSRALTIVGDYARHLILPGFAIAISYMAVVARVARASLVEAMRQDFTLLALAKGLWPRYVFWRHVLPNALLPIITVIGYSFGYALTGAILTETVFGWPGLGYLFMTSITNRDYPVINGIFLLATMSVVAANLATDLAYAVADPRVAKSYRGVA